MKKKKIHLLRFTKRGSYVLACKRKYTDKLDCNTWQYNTTCKSCLKVACAYNGVY